MRGGALASRLLSVGPLEVLVIECPGERLNAQIVSALASAVEGGTLRIIDVTFVHKDGAGRLTAQELAELEEHELLAYDFVDETRGLLSADDIRGIGERISCASSAILMVVEHAWTGRLERTILATDGRIVLHARIPPEVAIAALENSERVRQARRKGDDRCSGGG
jgi:hypothetical protein